MIQTNQSSISATGAHWHFSASTSSSDAKEYAQNMLKRMTLEEQVLLLTGSDLWRTNAVPRLGISKIKTSDGPVGVRGGLFADGVKAASLPAGYACVPRHGMLKH